MCTEDNNPDRGNVYPTMCAACTYQFTEEEKTMSEQENIKAANSLLEAWNSGDLRPALAYQAEDFKQEAPGSPAPMNREQNLAYNQNFLTAFPGTKFKVLLTVVQGDYVVTNWTISGKHTGPLHSPSGTAIPPTGKMVTVNGSTTAQLRNGKIAYAWTFFDMAGLLGQLGLIPPM
jgi:steroid delta-isomerase-like uncharacterized protein